MRYHASAKFTHTSLFLAVSLFTSLANAQTAAKDDLVEEVVVTGKFLKSLQTAAEIKRNSASVVEAISAEDIGQLPHEAPIKGGDHVQGHVFLVKQALFLRNMARTGLRHTGGIGIMRGDDIIAHGVIHARFAQVGGIERLVPDGAVAAGGKAVHHRSR